MITKAQLEQLRAERLRPPADLGYTPDGPLRIEVVTQVEHTRQRNLVKGEHTLHEALERLQRDQVFASHEGLVKAHFNRPKQEIEP